MFHLTFAIFTLAGIYLWTKQHKGWAVVCFVLALLILL
jgi:Gpi18-like mannosyltransferase